MECLDVPRPWHADQLHLVKWQAFSALEILFHIDQPVDAKSMARAQAKKCASRLIQDDATDDGPAPDARRCVTEDVGGGQADLDDDEPPHDLWYEKYK